MSAETPNPQPPREIDRADVLGELEHRFRTVTDDLPVIGRVLDELVELDILRYRKRAADLTYRVGNHNPRNIYRTTGDGDRRDGDEHVGVMFSPEDGPRVVAALNASASLKPSVRVPNEPHGPNDWLRREVAALAAKGHRDDAVDVLVQHTLLNEGGALAYVESMSEYQTYLAAHGEKQVPRVFRSDGPEPPAGVDVLEDEGPDWGDMKYLLRVCDLWCWSPSRELVPPDHSDPVLWERAARQAAGPLREVV